MCKSGVTTFFLYPEVKKPASTAARESPSAPPSKLVRPVISARAGVMVRALDNRESIKTKSSRMLLFSMVDFPFPSETSCDKDLHNLSKMVFQTHSMADPEDGLVYKKIDWRWKNNL